MNGAAIRCTEPHMKLIANILLRLSLIWLLVVALYNAARLLSAALPQIDWPRWLSRVPLPRPTLTFEWATCWPFLLGLTGMLVSIGLLVYVERRRNWKGRGKI